MGQFWRAQLGTQMSGIFCQPGYKLDKQASPTGHAGVLEPDWKSPQRWTQWRLSVGRKPATPGYSSRKSVLAQVG
jgi:hypothetical protein